MLALLFLFVYFLVLHRKFDMIVSDSVQQHHQECMRVILTCAVHRSVDTVRASNAAHRQRSVMFLAFFCSLLSRQCFLSLFAFSHFLFK